MPTPVISQPISRACDPATAAMFCGRLKMPEPIIELMTSAVSAARPIRDFSLMMCLTEKEGRHSGTHPVMVRTQNTDAKNSSPPGMGTMHAAGGWLQGAEVAGEDCRPAGYGLSQGAAPAP